MLWIHWFSIAFPLVFHWFSRPPMLINREGSTQSSIAKNFMESGCWLVQGLLIWFWHYIDVCLESSTQSYRLYSHVLQLNHVNSNCKFLYKSPTFCQFNSHTFLATTHIFDIFCRFQSMVSWWIPRNSPIQCQPDPGILIADTPMIDDQYRSKWNSSPELSNPWGYPKQSFLLGYLHWWKPPCINWSLGMSTPWRRTNAVRLAQSAQPRWTKCTM